MDNPRSHRVGELIQKEVSSLLLKGIKDPRVGFVTITAVEVTSDLRLARIYFSVMGDEAARQETEKGLKSSVPYLRRQLGGRLHMRHIPDLLFLYDSSLEYGSRIETLLKEIHSRQDDDQSDTEDD
ncbi:MAG: 30S ribosome-binding factor RbfA [Desulfuromonas sp.]|uniref:30S ribosome-binding factor RbfA n=1 Tax=Desulfuromonas sp. TaxID=892 RepID=UPI000CA65F3E|nr:30S ribosome-binding factor RbfA [Desulfuromonas sp.]PLX84747.1 MAG: 30S ribosome-binding factor RbfA [Desulfuromonas sp.]